MKINYVDFCHDSANHTSMLALAASKGENYNFDEVKINCDDLILKPLGIVGYERRRRTFFILLMEAG